MSASLKSFAAATALATTLTFAPANDAEAGIIEIDIDMIVNDVQGFNTINVGDKLEFSASFDDSILTDLNANPNLGIYNNLDLAADPNSSATFTINGVDLDVDLFAESVAKDFFGMFTGTSVQTTTADTVEGQSLRQFFFEGANPTSTDFFDGLSSLQTWDVTGQDNTFYLGGDIRGVEFDVIDTTPNPVPEPSTLLLIGVAGAAFGARKLLASKPSEMAIS